MNPDTEEIVLIILVIICLLMGWGMAGYGR